MGGGGGIDGTFGTPVFSRIKGGEAWAAAAAMMKVSSPTPTPGEEEVGARSAAETMKVSFAIVGSSRTCQ